MKQITIIFIILLLSHNIYTVHAANYEGISITPSFFDIKSTQGESKDITIEISNKAAENLILNYEIQSLRNGNKDYTNWFSTDIEFPYEFDSTKLTIPFTLTIPENTSSSGHYPIIIFKFQSTDNKSNFGAQQNMVTNFYIDTTEFQNEKKFTINYLETNKKIYFEPKFTINYQVLNISNIHQKPSGVINIYNPKYEIENSHTINPNLDNVFPGDFIENGFSWSKNENLLTPQIGYYTIEMKIFEGNNLLNPDEQLSKKILVIPKIYFFYLTILITILLYVMIVNKKKNNN